MSDVTVTGMESHLFRLNDVPSLMTINPTDVARSSMKPFVLPNSCVRVIAEDYLTFTERHLLGSQNWATHYDAAVVINLPRHLPITEIRSDVIPTLKAAQQPFVILRGHVSNPYPSMTDDGHPQIGTTPSQPRSMIILLRNSDSPTETVTMRLGAELVQRHPEAVLMPYVRVVRVEDYEIDAMVVQNLIDGRELDKVFIPINAEDIYKAIWKEYVNLGVTPISEVVESILWTFWIATIEAELEVASDVWVMRGTLICCTGVDTIRNLAIDTTEDNIALAPREQALLESLIQAQKYMDWDGAIIHRTVHYMLESLLSGDKLDKDSAGMLLRS